MADTQTEIFTDEDLATLPTGQGERYELIEGKLHLMSPAGGKHGAIANVISGEIYLYLKKNPIGRGVTAETGFYTRGDNHTVRAPDYGFIALEKLPDGKIPDGYLSIVPDLVVEVVSPYDTADEVEDKITEWLNFGLKLVWVIYPKTQRIYVYRQGKRNPDILMIEDTLTGDDTLPDFKIPVSTLFEV